MQIDTIDRYQGRDKSIIIVSFVRSNQEKKVRGHGRRPLRHRTGKASRIGSQVGKLLKDLRRINVALTRAKRKLILVGSAQTLAAGTVTCPLVNLLRSKQWVQPLPRPYAEAFLEGKGSAGDASNGSGHGTAAAATAPKQMALRRSLTAAPQPKPSTSPSPSIGLGSVVSSSGGGRIRGNALRASQGKRRGLTAVEDLLRDDGSNTSAAPPSSTTASPTVQQRQRPWFGGLRRSSLLPGKAEK